MATTPENLSTSLSETLALNQAEGDTRCASANDNVAKTSESYLLTTPNKDEDRRSKHELDDTVEYVASETSGSAMPTDTEDEDNDSNLESFVPLQDTSEKDAASKPTPSSTQELDILLIGKTGHGKSSTGNSILRRKAFKTSTKGESATYEVHMEYAYTDEYTVKIVDGPGVGDTRLNTVEATKKACGDMAKAMSMCPDGFHALLLVLQFGNRFTVEEEDTIQMLKGIFGDGIVRDYCICVITHGDDFDDRDEEDEQAEDFSEWLSEQTGALKKLFIECKYRCVLFRNKTKDTDIRRDQLIELLQMVRSLKTRDVRYTNEHFDKFKKQRDELLVKSKAPEIHEKIMKETNLIISDLTHLKETGDDLDKKDTILLRLVDNVSSLLKEVEEEDNHIGVLNILKDTVVRVGESIRIEMALNAQRKEDRKAREKLTNEHEIQILELEAKLAEEKRQLEEQLRTAGAEVKAELERKLEDLCTKARQKEEQMAREFEKRMADAAKDEDQKWQGRIQRMKSDHTQEIRELNSKYATLHEQATVAMEQKVKALTDELQALHRRRPPPKDPSKVTVHCKDQEGRSASAHILKSDPIKPVMLAYCGMSGYNMRDLRFLYDGQRVQEMQTPNELGLVDEDMIEVHFMQTGGSGNWC